MLDDGGYDCKGGCDPSTPLIQSTQFIYYSSKAKARSLTCPTASLSSLDHGFEISLLRCPPHKTPNTYLCGINLTIISLYTIELMNSGGPPTAASNAEIKSQAATSFPNQCRVFERQIVPFPYLIPPPRTRNTVFRTCV